MNFVAHLDIDPAQLVLQPEEVQEVKWVSLDEFRKLLTEDTASITDKPGCWDYYLRYLQSQV